MPHVVLYTTGPDCSLCERTEVDLEILRDGSGCDGPAFRLEVVDLRGREEVGEYAERVPVVFIDGRLAVEGNIAPSALRAALALATAGGDEG